MKLIDRILNPENLRLAWEEVAENKGARGIDDVSIKRWRRNWEERLMNLAHAVRANTYMPHPLRRFSIPKKDGSLRHLSILTVTDRVLQRAVLRVIDDRFDRLFLKCSYGYRPGRGVRDAVPVILDYRNQGCQWVLDADIDECFDSLDHTLLLEFLTEEIGDPIVTSLMRAWLRVGARNREQAVGVPLGAVLSPLFCNIYLHRLDAHLTDEGFSLVRYADDFCVFCTSQVEARCALRETEAILANLKLRLEPRKTNITHFEEGFDFLGVHFYRDTYSFTSQEKRIEVQGNFDPYLFYDYVPDGYE